MVLVEGIVNYDALNPLGYTSDGNLQYNHIGSFPTLIVDYPLEFQSTDEFGNQLYKPDDIFILSVSVKKKVDNHSPTNILANQLSDEGVLSTSQYGKKGFSYNSLDAVYRLETNELCVGSVFPISLKKFWIQPNNNGFCILPSGKFPSFQNATLIKKRRLFKDKLYNNKDIRIETNLKLTIIND